MRGRSKEAAPVIGIQYLMIGSVWGDTFRMRKMVKPSPENIEIVEQILKSQKKNLNTQANNQERGRSAVDVIVKNTKGVNSVSSGASTSAGSEPGREADRPKLIGQPNSKARDWWGSGGVMMLVFLGYRFFRS